MDNIVFIAKTNLNNDGRILNQIKILNEENRQKIKIDFILLPDKPFTLELDKNVEIHEVNPLVRNSKLFRPFSVIEFTLRALFKMIKLKPKAIHTQDLAVVLPVYLYRKIFGQKTFLIYDDHEMPNEDESFQYRMLQKFERKLMKMADVVIYANKERQEILDKELRLSNSVFFLNLPYFEDRSADREFTLAQTIKLMEEKRMKSFKFIMHQGIIEVERGRQKLAEFSKLLPNNYKILIVGVSKEYFDAFILEYALKEESFIFIGSVPYFELAEYWRLADASIVMYLPTYLNNKLCAPNRLYISFLNTLPIIVNKDNPVLSNFILDNSCGLFIEDLNQSNIDDIWNIHYSSDKIEVLKKTEIDKLINVYKNI